MKRKINKKVVLLSTLLILFVTLLVWVGSTNALPKAEDKKEVVTYVGNLKVDVQDIGAIGNIQIGATSTTNREFKVKNDGETNQFVRVMILPVYTNKSNAQEELKIEMLAKDLNTTNWKDGGDGYYYYLDKLEAGKGTSVLFSKLQIPSGKSEGKLTMFVKAESITTGGNQYQKAFWNTTGGPSAEPLKTIDMTLNGKKE